MRKFEKISLKQFNEDICPLLKGEALNKEYSKIEIPIRSTEFSAGYDIRALNHNIIPAGGKVSIPTGLKVCLPKNEVLLAFPRSSLGVKNGIVLANTVGVIDADYYDNPDNEGHIWIILKNTSDINFEINIGDKICQMIFIKYETTDNDNATGERTGGFGSTDKKED